MSDDVEGWEHVLEAARVLKAAVEDLFRLPGAAQKRAEQQRDALGEENHGDDLACGCWQAAMAATGLLELTGRHVDALIVLAEQHAAFSPSGNVLARAALESALRVSWLLEPDRATDREQRWIVFERETQRFYRNLGHLDAEDFAGRMETLDDLAGRIGGEAVAGVPTAETLAKSQGRTPQVYDFYRWGSQPTHGTMMGFGTLDTAARQEWLAQGGEGEWIEAEFWAVPITMAWEGLCVALPRYRNLLVPDEPLPSLDREPEFEAALRAIPPNFQARQEIEAQAARSRPVLNRSQRRAAERRARRR